MAFVFDQPATGNFSNASLQPELFAPALTASTLKERLVACGYFGMAGIAGYMNLSSGSVKSTLISLACEGVGVCISVAALSLFCRFKETKLEVSEADRVKFKHLQTKANEYSAAMGLRRAPQIRLWSRKEKAIDQARFFFHQPYVVFSEATLKAADIPTLEGILGHEMTHIKKGHGLSMGCLFLTADPTLNLVIQHPVLGLAIAAATVPLARAFSRRNEFQADRIGALVSKRATELANYLAYPDWMENIRSVQRMMWDYGTVSHKAKTIVKRGLLGLSRELFLNSHPNAECRVERLRTLTDTPRHYATDSFHSRVTRLIMPKPVL